MQGGRTSTSKRGIGKKVDWLLGKKAIKQNLLDSLVEHVQTKHCCIGAGSQCPLVVRCCFGWAREHLKVGTSSFAKPATPDAIKQAAGSRTYQQFCKIRYTRCDKTSRGISYLFSWKLKCTDEFLNNTIQKMVNDGYQIIFLQVQLVTFGHKTFLKAMWNVETFLKYYCLSVCSTFKILIQ